MIDDPRLQLLTDWIHQDWPKARIEVASADASFRRYFRITHNNKSYIAMDAPPEQEDCAPFIDVTNRLRQAGVHAPEIFRQDLIQGFLLLEDFGNTPYLDQLKEQSADALYADALDMLLKIQGAATAGLPEYDEEFLLEEMRYMPEWFIQIHLKITPNAQQQRTIDDAFTAICVSVLQQPQTFVHRDYHSRNLMLTKQNNPGVIDYQDAMFGPITYDLVSLLRDCYIQWPQQRVEAYVLQFKHLLELKKGQKSGGVSFQAVDNDTFIRWFDMMGLQRHIKVLGIFARLKHRDGKANYLDDLPLTLHYVMTVGEKYPATQPLIELFHEWNIPEKIGIPKL